MTIVFYLANLVVFPGNLVNKYDIPLQCKIVLIPLQTLMVAHWFPRVALFDDIMNNQDLVTVGKQLSSTSGVHVLSMTEK